MTACRYCETCGAQIVRPATYSNAQWHRRRFCDRKCASVPRMGQRECACGCGGRPLVGRKYVKGHLRVRLRPDGYRRVWRPDHPLSSRDGLVMEHRLVVYDAGIEIPDGYHVHHRNGIRDDNRLENLAVVEPAEHARLHARADGFVRNQYGSWPVRTAATVEKPS